MRNAIRIFAGMFAAFLFYTAFSRVFPPVLLLFNVFSLVFLYFAVEKGEVYGSCLGAVCGLIQDFFSAGVFGVAGLAKTITGYLAGYLSKKIDVQPFLRNFLFIMVMISFELLVWLLLYSFIIGKKISPGGRLIILQPLATALMGSVLFFMFKKLRRKDQI